MNAWQDLRRRRAVLQARSGMERRRLAAQAARLTEPLAGADRLTARARRLLGQPGWLLALAGALLVLRPRRVLAWSGPALTAWRLWRAVTGATKR